MGNLGRKVKNSAAGRLLLHCDNSAVVHILNAMVSASRALMRELRRPKQLLNSMGLYIDA
jgi:hypothetical protein